MYSVCVTRVFCLSFMRSVLYLYIQKVVCGLGTHVGRRYKLRGYIPTVFAQIQQNWLKS